LASLVALPKTGQRVGRGRFHLPRPLRSAGPGWRLAVPGGVRDQPSSSSSTSLSSEYRLLGEVDAVGSGEEESRISVGAGGAQLLGPVIISVRLITSH
jgi:hypothetical protein